MPATTILPLWYVHEVSKQQVEGGLAGMIMVGNPLDPWPQYKATLTYYVLATIVVEGDLVTTAAPVFAQQRADPLWEATPDFTRTFSLEQLATVDGVDPDTGEPIVNIDNFYVNGKKFGEGVMPQLEIGTVEEWTILNAGPLNHPFHIHQGVFIAIVNTLIRQPMIRGPQHFRAAVFRGIRASRRRGLTRTLGRPSRTRPRQPPGR